LYFVLLWFKLLLARTWEHISLEPGVQKLKEQQYQTAMDDEASKLV
jgi:hypothetical protein